MSRKRRKLPASARKEERERAQILSMSSVDAQTMHGKNLNTSTLDDMQTGCIRDGNVRYTIKRWNRLDASNLTFREILARDVQLADHSSLWITKQRHPLRVRLRARCDEHKHFIILSAKRPFSRYSVSHLPRTPPKLNTKEVRR